MTDLQNIADTYFAAWNAPDQAERLRGMDGWAEDACYVDPMMHGEGREQIAEMIEAARAHFPGHSFTMVGMPDGHGAYVRFSWALAPAGDAPVARGTDMIRLNDDGRIASVVGFLDKGAA